MASEPVVILVHGAWHGPGPGQRHRAPRHGRHAQRRRDLPSMGETRSATSTTTPRSCGRPSPRPTGRRSSSPTPTAACPTSEGGAGAAAHRVLLTAFVLEPGQSLLGARGGEEPEWWIGSEDGLSLLPGQPAARLLQRLLARGRPSAPPQHSGRTAAASVRPGARDGGLADACRRPTSSASATTRSRRAVQEMLAGRCGHRPPARHEPLALPLAPGRRDRRSSRRRSPLRRSHDLDELGRQPVLRGARRRAGRRGRGRRRGAPRDRGGHGPPRGRRRPLVHAR